MIANKILQAIDCFGFGNVEFHRGFADVEIDLSRGAADVTEIGIRHFTGAVHDAAHDRDLYAFQMRGRVFDASGRGLQIKERPSTRWTGDVVGLENAAAGRLENVVAKRNDWPGAASACTRMASPIPSQSSEPMFDRSDSKRSEGTQPARDLDMA